MKQKENLFSSLLFLFFFLTLLPLVFAFANIVISLYENTFLKEILSFLFSWLIFYALFKLSVNKQIDNKAALISSFLTLLVLSITKTYLSIM